MTSERNREKVTFDEVVTQAKATILKDNYHSPILILEGNRTSLVHLISDMPETHGERLALMSVLGSSIAKSGRAGQLLQVFSVTEGWLSITPKGQLPAM